MAACDEGTAPPPTGSPGITFLTGNGQSDTVDALLPVRLTVEVRDTGGRLIPGTTVHFVAVPDTALALGNPLVAPLSGGTPNDAVFGVTNDDGNAGVLVRLGGLAGTARVAVSVPIYGWSDTATFAVAPGNPVVVEIAPRDTTVPAGASYQIRTVVADRHGNLSLEAPTIETPDSAGATVTNTGIVTAVREGRWRILASVPQFPAATGYVNVFPSTGTLVVATPSGVTIVEMDGTIVKSIAVPSPGPQGRYPTWISPTAIAAQDGQSQPELFRIDTDGTVTPLLLDSSTTTFELWPQASRDGEWIHFAGKVPNYSTSGLSLWRIRPDGSDLERVSPPNVDGESETCPSPSPDGTRVVASTTRFGSTFLLAIVDVATRNLTSLGEAGIQPRWAPTGESIAYLGGPGYQEVWVVNAGTGIARRVSPAGRSYAYGIDWTPSQAWLIARSAEGLELINIATGDIVPLNGFPAGSYQPALVP
jgi:hypothetical protein